MVMISMGTNTEPYWVHYEKLLKSCTDEKKRKYYKDSIDKSIKLRDTIISLVERGETCELSWDCIGRTRHEMHARQWEEAMPEYEFEIGYNYHCVVRKRG